MIIERAPAFLFNDARPSPTRLGRDGRKLAWVNKGMERFAEVMKAGFIQYELASRSGFLQGLDARLKIVFLLSFAVIISLKKTILAEVVIGIFLFALAAVSRLDLVKHYKKVLFLGFFFGFFITLPSALNFVSTGRVVVPLIHFSQPHDFWVYRVPRVLGFTEEGLRGVAMLTLRVMNSLAASFLVISTTPFFEFIKALKVMRVPDAFLMTLSLSYKYIFLFCETVYDMHLAKKARLVGPEAGTETRRWMAGRMAFMFRKSQHRCEEVLKAMRQRGPAGSISLHGYRVFTRRDWLMGFALLATEIILLLI